MRVGNPTAQSPTPAGGDGTRTVERLAVADDGLSTSRTTFYYRLHEIGDLEKRLDSL